MVEHKMMNGSSNGWSSPYSSSGDELRHETVDQIFPQSSFCKVDKDGIRSISNRYNFTAKILKEGDGGVDVNKQSQSCRWTAAQVIDSTLDHDLYLN